jgi:GT2 family glycosyltransferase
MVDSLPACAVIIPTYQGGHLTAACLDAFLSRPPSECDQTIVVVDDGSTDDTLHALGRFGSRIKLVVQETNQGFARACNAGARAAGDVDYLVFLNNDTLPTPGWLDALLRAAQEDESIAAVGAKLLFSTGQVQHAGVVIGQDGWPHHLYAGFPASHPAVDRSRDVPAVTAACMLIRQPDFNGLDGFDPAFHNGYEDVDLCLRLGEQGRRIRYCHRSVVYHLESVTRWPTGAPEEPGDAAAVYDKRWRSRVAPDDVQHYLDDDLLSFSYGPYYPLSITAAPELGVVSRDAVALRGLDRLVALRSRQVMELLSNETRRQLGARVQNLTPSLAPPLRSSGVTHVADGRVHQLGRQPTDRLISVLLPVKDGARFLSDMLPLLLGQSLPSRLEIIAVDSGSRDDSVDVLVAHGATVLSIAPVDFDHGLTRNLAAEHAHGDIFVFLSQRARPISDGWLAPLVAALDADPEVAGACSRVLPYPDADLLTLKDGERELSGSAARQRNQITDWRAYVQMTEHERRVFLNFHTVSAAIRAEAWRRTPFRSVRTLGEDLLWARDTVEAGWALVHEPASCVHHSHDYSLDELFARNVDDGIANRDITGRTVDRAQILPQITAMARDDWSYLRNSVGLTGAELERWQLQSVLRRTAQTVGQWLGANHEELPEGTAAQFSSMPRTRAASPSAPRPKLS